jgi:hypothetical protein
MDPRIRTAFLLRMVLLRTIVAKGVVDAWRGNDRSRTSAQVCAAPIRIEAWSSAVAI